MIRTIAAALGFRPQRGPVIPPKGVDVKTAQIRQMTLDYLTELGPQKIKVFAARLEKDPVEGDHTVIPISIRKTVPEHLPGLKESDIPPSHFVCIWPGHPDDRNRVSRIEVITNQMMPPDYHLYGTHYANAFVLQVRPYAGQTTLTFTPLASGDHLVSTHDEPIIHEVIGWANKIYQLSGAMSAV